MMGSEWPFFGGPDTNYRIAFVAAVVEGARMSRSENDRTATRWFEEVWNERRSETIDELLHSWAVPHGQN